MRALSRSDPNSVSVGNQMPGSGATGTYHGWLSVTVPFNITGTGQATISWINPETGTVLAKALMYFTSAGTGTYDLGRGDDGTGTNADLIDGGTMTVGAHYPGTVLGTVDASSTIGGLDRIMFLIGPGGTGTNNSFIVAHTGVQTTAVGGLLVEYYPVGR